MLHGCFSNCGERGHSLVVVCRLLIEGIALFIAITHLEPDIMECEVKWALESITTNRASGGDGIPVELFQILKDDAVTVLPSICQQIWKTQQWPQDWKRSFHSNPKERSGFLVPLHFLP